MRTEQFKVGDQTYTICPLSLSQTIAMLAKNKEAKIATEGAPTPEESDAILGIMYDVICDSFNNAEKTIAARSGNKILPESALWTRERLLEEIDQRTFGLLHEAVLTISDLKRVKEEGESQGPAQNGESATAPSTGTK